MNREIILHCYQWRLKDITANLDKIKESGFTVIQTSPVQGCKNDGNQGWLLYQPLDLAFVESKQIGSEKDFEELCVEAHKRGLKIIVDVILRHVAGQDDGALIPHCKVSKCLTCNCTNWAADVCNATNYEDRQQIINYATGLPMLDYRSESIQKRCIDFLNALEKLGADGFRLDQLKHFALPSEGCDFLEKVFDPFKNDLTYGEVLECDYNLLSEYVKHMKVLSWKECDNMSQRVLYIETHDTFHTWKFTSNLDDNKITNEWRNLLINNKENNVIFFPRPFNNLWNSEEIKKINKELR